jgi:hypothetical protein
MNWTEMQRTAVMNFLNESSPVRAGLDVFVREQAEHWRSMCAANMATVPRNPEAAADYAARALAYDEFWRLLEFAVAQDVAVSS